MRETLAFFDFDYHRPGLRMPWDLLGLTYFFVLD
jgi:hypothetical protein